MTHDAFALIAAHLMSSLGMNASVLENTQLRRAIRRRMEAAGLRSAEAYAEHYRTSGAEQELLAEEIYIHETCFFRDSAVFTESLRWVQQWLGTHAGPISILSAPCSTGEEPYSIAATLLAGGVPAERIRIHAVDVSASALAAAQRAVYNGMALRNIADPASESFLRPAGNSWTVAPEVGSVVTFERINLLADSPLPEAAYDLVFCRNLLIYLDPTARVRVANTLRAALRADGRLVLGAADWSSDLHALFRMDGPGGAFSFRPIVPAAEIPGRSRPVRQLTREVRPDAPVRRASDAQVLYERALSVMDDSAMAERLCRQALYLQGDHLPSLELLSRLWRSRASHRMNRALAARLRRRRLIVREGQ